MKRILTPVLTVLAVIYFLVDAVLLPVAKRISDRIAEHWVLGGLRNWIVSLRPYPTLLLFAVPVIVLYCPCASNSPVPMTQFQAEIFGSVCPVADDRKRKMQEY